MTDNTGAVGWSRCIESMRVASNQLPEPEIRNLLVGRKVIR